MGPVNGLSRKLPLGYLVRLVDNLLDVSRITRDKLELRMTQVELASVIHQAVETCRAQVEHRGYELTVTLPSEPVYLEADPVRLMQVFSNLLNNACKYTEPGGRISLMAQREAERLVVSVKDTGRGIAPEHLSSVFGLFVQVEPDLDRSQGGLGIGLTLARQIVGLHGGSLEVSSEGIGRGSEFIVRLPIVIEAPSNERPTPDDNDPAPGTLGTRAAPRRILVVDDNCDSANSLAQLLNMSGHQTEVAHDGPAAIEAAGRFQPDIVLLDIGLPGLSGYDVCRAIRREAWGRRAVLVALTGWGQQEDRQKTHEAGFDRHFVKPVDYDALMNVLFDGEPAPCGIGHGLRRRARRMTTCPVKAA